MCKGLNNAKLFFINVVTPILIGAIIYYLFFPEAAFVNLVDAVFKHSFHILINLDTIFFKLIRFYVLDFLWAYGFMSAVLLVSGNCKRLVLFVFLFEVILEVLQLHPRVKGTFDVCDICVEIIANILVINILGRRYKHEEV